MCHFKKGIRFSDGCVVCVGIRMQRKTLGAEETRKLYLTNIQKIAAYYQFVKRIKIAISVLTL